MNPERDAIRSHIVAQLRQCQIEEAQLTRKLSAVQVRLKNAQDNKEFYHERLRVLDEADMRESNEPCISELAL